MARGDAYKFVVAEDEAFGREVGVFAHDYGDVNVAVGGGVVAGVAAAEGEADYAGAVEVGGEGVEEGVGEVGDFAVGKAVDVLFHFVDSLLGAL